jgi:hypothetical protein
VIPAQFEYLAPASLEEALAALAEHGDDAKILAGGQSLLPVLRMRLNAPAVVIDLGKITSLRGIREDGDAIVIGAMTEHSGRQRQPEIARHPESSNPFRQQRTACCFPKSIPVKTLRLSSLNLRPVGLLSLSLPLQQAVALTLHSPPGIEFFPSSDERRTPPTTAPATINAGRLRN